MTEYEYWARENTRRTSWSPMDSGLDHMLTQGLDPERYGWQWVRGYWVPVGYNLVSPRGPRA